MLDFIKRVGVTFNSVRFYYQDEPILPTFSAEFLEMKDGDTIDVLGRRNFRPTAATQSTLITLPLVVDGEKPVVLKVKDCTEDGALYYLIGRNTPMKNLLHDYADCINELYEHVKFSCVKCCCIGMRETADDLGLEDWRCYLRVYVTVQMICAVRGC
ncbi:Small ubiquitin-related modifier, SUMO [Gossypium australe]|uniref:Small ubiquitin-related modifier, SUMO n=1 Tax=Gossypium australe TaxID=47621 RepID=A0A5B6WIV0_9ROSI|nr:Small ubiquitin-related modifier, SUMO [Gossypium australe]